MRSQARTRRHAKRPPRERLPFKRDYRKLATDQNRRSKTSDLWNERMSAFKRNPISTAGVRLRGSTFGTPV